MRAVDPPPEIEVKVDALFLDIQTAIELAPSYARGFIRGDAHAVEAADEQIGTVVDRSNRLALELGLEACLPEVGAGPSSQDG